MVAGTPVDSTDSTYAGAAYVFVRVDGKWSQQARLARDVPSAFAEFGYSVAISGDTLVVGAPGEDAGGTAAGAVYVFVRQGTTWSQQAMLTPSDPADDKNFGASVAIDGETLVVGGLQDSDQGPNAGAAYVFVRNGTSWSQQTKLTADNFSPGNLFGFSVAISSGTVAVGSPYDDDAGLNAGAVYIFTRSGTIWREQTELFASSAADEDRLGWSVALDGDTAVAGAPRNLYFADVPGSAHVFVRSGTTWNEQARLVASDGAATDGFGSAVGFKGDTAVIGSRFDSSFAAGGGSVYLFTRSGTAWNRTAELASNDIGAYYQFGYSVGTDGPTIVVGAPLAGDPNAGEYQNGAAYVFASASNTAPVAHPQSVTTAEDTAVAITLSGSDAEAAALTFAVVSGPANGTLRGRLPNLTYAPNLDFNGSDSFTFKANDGQLDSATATVSINITPVNDAPVADSQSVTTLEDTAVVITLTGSDVEGSPLTFAVLTGPTKGTLSGAAPNLTYTPNANVNGSDSFTFKANDGELDSAPATVSITITPVNDAPVADNLSVTTLEDTAVVITLTGSDVEGSPLTFAVLTGPTKGTLSGTTPNLTYTPSANANGADSFTFKVTDGQLDSAPATVSIKVTSVNDAPTISKIANQTIARNSSTGPIAFTVGDMDNNPGSLTVSATSSNPTLVPDCNIRFGGSGANRTITVTPTRKKVGVATITVTVSDGLATVSTSFTITVTRSNHPSDDDEDDRDLEVNSPRRMRPGKSPTR